MLALELPEDIENRLDILSLGTGHTRQYYVMEALLEYLDEVEEKHREWERIADQCVETTAEGVTQNPD